MIWVQLLFADIWSSLSDLFNAKTIWAQNSFTFRSWESFYPLLQLPIFCIEVYRRICMNRYLPRFLYQVCREISWHRVANRCISLMLTDNMLRLGFILQVLLTHDAANISIASLRASLAAKLHWPLWASTAHNKTHTTATTANIAQRHHATTTHGNEMGSREKSFILTEVILTLQLFLLDSI